MEVVDELLGYVAVAGLLTEELLRELEELLTDDLGVVVVLVDVGMVADELLEPELRCVLETAVLGYVTVVVVRLVLLPLFWFAELLIDGLTLTPVLLLLLGISYTFPL